jgi:hypothetical protein
VASLSGMSLSPYPLYGLGQFIVNRLLISTATKIAGEMIKERCVGQIANLPFCSAIEKHIWSTTQGAEKQSNP